MTTTPLQRPDEPVITELLSEHWAVIADDVTGTLVRRGVRPHDAADVVQEVAYRSLRSGVDFDGPQGLRRWAYTVARNLVVEQARRERRLAPWTDAETDATDDVAATVEQRVALGAVARAFARLPSTDQEALRDAAAGRAGGRESRKDAVRSNVRRHRARQRLLALCEGALATAGWLWRRTGRPTARVATVLTSCVGVAAAVLLLSLGDAARPDAGDLVPAAGTTAPVASAPTTPPLATRAAVSGSTPPDEPPPGPTTAPGAAQAQLTPTLSPVAVLVPGVGRDGAVGWRPREPEDHLVCADTVAGGDRCTDAPAVAVSLPSVRPPA